MFGRSVAVLLSMFCLVSSASAADKPIACYANKYDKQHLAKNKGQTITAIKVLLLDATTTENSGVPIFAQFEVTLRGKGKTRWGDRALCAGKAGNWKCQIECDGGGFDLAEDATGMTLSNSRGFRVTADGGCGEQTDEVEAKPGNRLFRLSKAKLSACK